MPRLLPFLLLLPIAGLTPSLRAEEPPALSDRVAQLRRLVIECIERVETLESAIDDLPPGDDGTDRSWAPGGPFAGRIHKDTLRLHGGSGRTERAVERALAWLAAHQSPSGAWEAARFHEHCNGRPVVRGPEGRGLSCYDVGVSGLALAALLGGGHTHRSPGRVGEVVGRGLGYLLSVQDPGGCFGPRNTTRHYIYNHACASLAVIEAYGMTHDIVLLEPAQRALAFIYQARNPHSGWRYGVRPGDNDTAVTGWMASVIASAQLVNQYAEDRGHDRPFRIDRRAIAGVRAWIGKMTDPDYCRVGYIQRGGMPARPEGLRDTFPGDRSESMTAVGLTCHIFLLGTKPGDRLVAMGAELCAKCAPQWKPARGVIDLYFWYFGSMSLHQVGRTSWRLWNRSLQDALLRSQRRDDKRCQYDGSWDPLGPWGPDGGRVYATAMAALCLESYYRYDRFTK